MSTNIPPHNLREVAKAFRRLVKKPACTVKELMKDLPGPDFPTGGFILGREGIRDMYETGRGRVVMRARVVCESLRGGKEQLVVSEIPYGISKTRVIEQIVDLSRKGKLEDVSDVRDESDREGMRLVVQLKRGGNAAITLDALYGKTNLQTTFGAILLALDKGEPKEFNLKQLLERYRDHRLDVVVRRCRFELEEAEAERHIVEGLLLALDHLDEVVKIIRGSKDRPQASDRLQKRFGLSDVQADAILNMRLGKLTALERKELRARLAELERRIADLRRILASEEEQLRVVVEELDAVTESWGDDRRTEILEEGEEAETSIAETLADEDVVVTVSHEGFVKRMPVHLYRRRVSGGRALAGMENYPNDWLERVFTARTGGWLVACTEGGRLHTVSVQDVPESARASRGHSIYALADADRADRIVSILPVEDLASEGRLLLFVTRGGLAKRTPLAEFSSARAGGIIAAGVREEDRILEVVLSEGRADVILLTKEGRAIRFPENEIPTQGRTAQGVKGIGLRGDDEVIGVVLVRRDASVLSMSEEGWGKRTPLSEFPLQKRGGLGTLAIPAGGKGGRLVAALEVVPGDEVTVVTAGGEAIPLEAESVPEQGRRTKGGRVVKIAPGDRVSEVTRSVGSRREDGDAGVEEPESEEADAEEEDNDQAPREAVRATAKPDGRRRAARQPDLFGE
jgi:DNA gyrase subunit A